MKVVDPGHTYALRSLDGGVDVVLSFVKREGPGYPGNKGHYPGTTSQEVLRALIERGEYVNSQIPCAETEAVIHLMRSALLLLEARAARRHGRALELDHLADVENAPTCAACGHIDCRGSCREHHLLEIA